MPLRRRLYSPATMPLNVLLVDDSAFYRESLQVVIGDFLPENSKIFLAKSSEEAWRLMNDSSNLIHCVLLDLNLAGESGLALVSPFRKKREDMAIIMITGDEEMSTALRCMQEGAEDYVVKGQFSADSLERTIRYAVERVEARMRTVRLEAELKQERQLSAMQKSFIHLVNHEFRTPLAIISSASQWMRSMGDASHAPTVKRLDKIDRAVQRLEGLMGHVAILTRMEEGDLACQPYHMGLHTLLNVMVKNMQDAMPERVISLDVSELPEHCHADPDLLQHILRNVLVNALKYSESQKSRVEISGKLEQDRIAFYIRDYGSGIAAEDIPYLGEKFFRAQSTHGVPGTGLGLYLTRQFLEYHEGWMVICSEREKGTIVKITIPAKSA